MQPTYLPWIGYFAMMDSVDVFVLLDSVAFDKRSWQQRNRIKSPAGAMWLTVPVRSKGRRGQLIRDVAIDRGRDFPAQHRRAIEVNYARAPYFKDFADEMFPLIERECERLVEVTVPIIGWCRARLGIDTEIVSGSALKGNGRKSELLASMCEELGAATYVSPPSSRDYLETCDAFSKRGIDVRYFEYDHPVYPQRFGEFVPHLSVIDLLMNAGAESAATMRRGTGKPAVAVAE
jgi:hypothetical protein